VIREIIPEYFKEKYQAKLITEEKPDRDSPLFAKTNTGKE
jgi:hypothetical protein